MKALKLDQNFPEAKEAKQALDEIGAKYVTAGEAGVYVDTGLTSLRKNDPKAAESSFKKALEVDPKYTRARAALATLYFAMGDQEKGEQELILAAKSDPENEELLHHSWNLRFQRRAGWMTMRISTQSFSKENRIHSQPKRS